MTSKNGTRIIAIEEHYFDTGIAKEYDDRTGFAGTPVRKKLDDLYDLRIKDMDASGIDVQVLSQGAPGVQRFSPEKATALAIAANNRLHEACQRYPDRFAGFTTLASPAPEAAADELERTVKDYGFTGGMIHGLTNGEFIDQKKFWPIFARAELLNVPIYIHPAVPHPDVVKAYYADYLSKFPSLLTAAWGFTVETATGGIRLVLSEIFEEYPKLQIILGHLGEGLPFLLWRIDDALARDNDYPFRDKFCNHFHITTSGNFSDPAMLCSMMELGIDRIMFSVDYPFAQNVEGTGWMERISLSPDDKKKVLHQNAERLLKI
ncbi:MAG: amidohydrolase family protein [Pseudomonadota bacterium]|nr:amidohydrolase family protein [Pseudomonadota bacterium]